MKKLLSLALFIPIALGAQVSTTTLNIGTTPVATVLRPGINLGGNSSNYGQLQMMKRLNQMNFGYLPPPSFSGTFSCSNAGTTNTTTSWYSNVFSSTGYPANFFSGASFTYMPTTGGTATTGTITASTSNISTTTGITFTLSTALPSACLAGSNTTNTDILIVRKNNFNVGDVPPSAYGGILNSSATFSGDTSPESTNTFQSLSLSNGLTQNFYMDAVFSTWAPDPSLHNVTWLNINGTYTVTYKAKCTGASGSVAYSVGRTGSASWTSGTDTLPSCSATSGSGWQTYNHTFTASETGSQTQGIALSYTVTSAGGNVLLQDMDLVEGSTLTGNTTQFRDAVVRSLQNINPGSLRLMAPPSWSSSVSCQIAALGMQCASSLKGGQENSLLNSIGYDDFLQLAYLLQAEPYITLGSYNTPADITTMVNWLASSNWTSKFKALGLKIHVADVNEAWNTGAAGVQDGGHGKFYGALSGPRATAFRAASGYDGTELRFVASNQFTGSQSYAITGGGWINNFLLGSGCSASGASTCPDEMEIAPYTLDTLTNVTDLQTDETAEGSDLFTASCPYTGGCSVKSVTATQNSLLNQRGIQTVAYEASYSPTQGPLTSLTQAQMNAASSSVSMALNTYRNAHLARRDSGVYGPWNEFAFVDQPYNGGTNNMQHTSWSAMEYMAAGPGQLSTFPDVARPIGIIMQVGNTAIGSNSKLMTASQSGQPTLNYIGGQGDTVLTLSAASSASGSSTDYTGTITGGASNALAGKNFVIAGFANAGNNGTFVCTASSTTTLTLTNSGGVAETQAATAAYHPSIPANTAVNLVDTFVYGDGAGNYTVLAFNMSPNNQTLNFSGAGAPTGTVSKTVFGSASSLYSTNLSSISNNSPAAAVAVPTATTWSAASTDTLPADSMTVYSYSTSGGGGGSNDFSIASSPTSLSLVAGNSGTSTISTAVSAGSAATVSLAVTGAPSGVTASLSPTSVTAGGSSTLTVTTTTGAAAGTYTLTVTGTEGSATHTATVTLTVSAPSAVTGALTIRTGAAVSGSVTIK